LCTSDLGGGNGGNGNGGNGGDGGNGDGAAGTSCSGGSDCASSSCTNGICDGAGSNGNGGGDVPMTDDAYSEFCDWGNGEAAGEDGYHSKQLADEHQRRMCLFGAQSGADGQWCLIQ
jgi:hypothetical protein